MNSRASLSAPARRARRIVVPGLAILGVAVAAFVVRPSDAATVPSADVSPSTTAPTVPAAPTSLPPVQPAVGGTPGGARVGQSTGAQTAIGVADGVVARGATVSPFDDALPAVGKLHPDLRDALRRSASDAAADGVTIGVRSGWRSPNYQQQLLQDAVRKYGSREAAARWVATPETSAHVSGEAVDIGPSRAAAWLSTHGAAYGLCRIYRNEPWHYELRPAAVTSGCPRMFADPTEDPRMQR